MANEKGNNLVRRQVCQGIEKTFTVGAHQMRPHRIAFLCAAIASATMLHSVSAESISPTSIIVNGGFEDPLVPYPSGFTIFGTVPGWEWTGENGIEVHRFLNGWLPYEGSQYTEATNQAITYQSLSTVPGKDYQLTYAYSPRPGVADNPLDVLWDGQVIATHNTSGLGNVNTAWSVFSFNVIASSSTTLLEFRTPRLDVGTYLDAVDVTYVTPLPSAASMLVVAFLGLASRRGSRLPRGA
jgi:hypothetical protein